MGVMYRSLFLTHKVIHVEFGTIKNLNLYYMLTPPPCQFHCDTAFGNHVFTSNGYIQNYKTKRYTKKTWNFENICLYETGKVAVSARAVSSDVRDCCTICSSSFSGSALNKVLNFILPKGPMTHDKHLYLAVILFFFSALWIAAVLNLRSICSLRSPKRLILW